MKKQLLQLSIAALSLVFIAIAAHAYTPPVSAPGAGNTDGPLTADAVNQVKAGGLSVGTFQAQKDAYFDQNVLFNGLLLGGTAGTTTSTPVTFGGTANTVNVNFSGAVSINGVYQSNTLENTASTPQPICADANGTIFLCGTTPPATTSTPVQNVGLYLTTQVFPTGTFIVAGLTQSVDINVSATVTIASPSAGTSVSMIKNFYTANAVAEGECNISSTPTTLGTLTIYAGDTSSSAITGGQLGYPSGCTSANSEITISSYSPHVDGEGRSIVLSGS